MSKQGEFTSNKLLKTPFLKVPEWFVKTYGHNVLPHFLKRNLSEWQFRHICGLKTMVARTSEDRLMYMAEAYFAYTAREEKARPDLLQLVVSL
jgi:hypothetical protein